MTAPSYTLYYFDSPGRASPVRLAFQLCGVEFEDKRLKREEWAEMKAGSLAPWKVLPVLEVKKGGETKVVAETSAILAYVVAAHGSAGDMARSDPLEVARIEEVRSAMEGTIGKLVASMVESDDARKAKMREELAATTLPAFLAALESRLQPDGHVSGTTLTVGDLVVLQVISWLEKGVLDGIPATITEPYKRIAKCCANVRGDPRIEGHPDIAT